MHYSTLLQLALLAQLGSASKLNPGHKISHDHKLNSRFANRAATNSSGYTLSDNYPTGLDFFSKFTFFTDSDPTHGYVTYVDQSTATSDGLIAATNGTTYIGVDNKNVASGTGRNSVRLTSTATYNKGLFVLDLAHMPSSACGSWPAFWTVGGNWPNDGEIDIIEGVNQQSGDAMTLHTSEGCTINTSGFTGTLATSNCWNDAPGQSNNAGCGIDSTDPNSYGSGNSGGGVYVMEWTDSLIQIFFFDHSNVPSDLTSGSPNPSVWGQPAALFTGGCQIDNFFQNHNIIFDITFCGDWAGAVWSTGSCASSGSSCNDYVQNNPSAFANTYWEINSLKVYTRS